MTKSSAVCFFLGLSAALAQTPPADSGFVLQGGAVHTIDGPVIQNGSVLVRNGKIVGVGKNLTAPQGFKVIDVLVLLQSAGVISWSFLGPTA